MKNLSNLYPERNVQDIKRMLPFIGKTYFEYNRQNPDEYRTIHMHLNVFTSKVTPLYSNYIYGTVPSHLEPIQPQFLSAVMRYNALQNQPLH